MNLRSEDDFLALIDRHFPHTGPGILTGRGDDCAVLSLPDPVCLTTDLFLENVHFRLDYFAPADVGYKALAVNLSDVAGMGASPVGFALGLMVPEGLDEVFFEGLFAGMAGLADTYDVRLVGGDLCRADQLGLSITVWGESPRFLGRGGCRAGDLLFLVGPVGLARVGLHILESGPPRAEDEYPAALAAHRRPDMHIKAARSLARMDAVHALMDVSDGLARDLPRFLAPSQGLDITLEQEDLHPEVLRYAAQTGTSPLEWALLGGEDYALLGAVAPEGLDALQDAVPETLVLGKVTHRPGLYLKGTRVQLAGFDHFSKDTA